MFASVFPLGYKRNSKKMFYIYTRIDTTNYNNGKAYSRQHFIQRTFYDILKKIT